MTKIELKNRMKQQPLILDGAMGTQLFARGVQAGKCNDYLNIEASETVLEIQTSYINAGSDAIITNTFGANKIALKRHNLGDKVEQINKSGVQIAKKAAGDNNYVMGDIGPCGDFLAPIGLLKPEELKDVFIQQANALLDAGVDGFIIETMTALDEVSLAIEAVKQSCDLPVFVSMSFDAAGDDFKTMMGVDVDSAVNKICSYDIDAAGFNCGTLSLQGYVKLAEKFAASMSQANKDVTMLAEINAGIPELVDDKAVYNVMPEEFAQTAEKILSVGFGIIGGCCGTGPEHIKALAQLK